jgi:ParB/RepB/Spo0J family partition protein
MPVITYQTVPIDSLRTDPNQPRKHINPMELKEMAVSIKSEGVINPIEIDEDNVIITGERRWRSAKIAELKEVPVKILKGLTPDQRFIRQVQENIHQNTMSPLDTAEALEKIAQITAPTAVEVAKTGDIWHNSEYFQRGVARLNKLLGVPETTVRRYLDLLHVSPDLKKALSKKGFQMTKVSSIESVPEEFKVSMEKLIATQVDIPRDTVRDIAAAVNRAYKYGEVDKAKKVLSTNYEGKMAVEALHMINKIVPTETERVKVPADALKIGSQKVMDLLAFLEDHDLKSFDDFHRPLWGRKLTSLGFYLQGYLQGKDMKNIAVTDKKLLK